MISPEKHEFFESLGHTGVTFGDVRTEPGPMDEPVPDMHWEEFFQQRFPPLDITTQFSRNVKLNIPIVSAAMDRVTESHMAITMAKLGGLGVIHCAMPVERQKDEATKVKLHLNGVIEKPVSFTPDQTVGHVLSERERLGLDFWTYLVADGENRLMGLLTERDFRFARSDNEQLLSEIMLPAEQVITAKANTTADDAYAMMAQHRKSMLPLLDDTGRVAGLYILSDVERALEGNPQNHNLDAAGRLVCAIAVPLGLGARERIDACRKYIDVVVLDTAHGDSPAAFKTYEMIRDLYPDLDVVVGNISSRKSAKLWAERRVDGIKVGQGGGSICTTRIETGIGIPQVTAVYQCVREAEKYDIPVTADGGISTKGDLTVITAAGASAVMLGNMLAGTEEAPGREHWKEGRKVKEYRGMGSEEVFMERPEAKLRYTDDPDSKPIAEGVPGHVPYKGPVERVVTEIIKGLRKGMAYSGRIDLKDHRDNTMLVMGTGNALAEAKPHGLI